MNPSGRFRIIRKKRLILQGLKRVMVSLLVDDDDVSESATALLKKAVDVLVASRGRFGPTKPWTVASKDANAKRFRKDFIVLELFQIV